jgi:hypothetical protein
MVFKSEPASQFDRVNAEPVEHIFIHDGHLLDGIIDTDRAFRKLQAFPQVPVGDCRDS